MISQPAVPSVQVRYGLLEVHVALNCKTPLGAQPAWPGAGC
jgi:hypothetical protein